MIVVLALLAILAHITFSGDISFYKKKTFTEEVTSLYLSLMHTRIASMLNVCFGISCFDGKVHGVRVESDRYTLFQGGSFSDRDAAQDKIIFFSSSISATSTGDVVFEQLNGNTKEGVIAITDDTGLVVRILINEEGRIEKE
jgi:Tfp pilus assembly protein FimT